MTVTSPAATLQVKDNGKVSEPYRRLRKIRCCPTQATELVNAVQVLILAG